MTKKEEVLKASSERATVIVNTWLQDTRGMPAGMQIARLGSMLANELYKHTVEIGYKAWNKAIEECRKMVIESFREAAPIPDDPLTDQMVESWDKTFNEMKAGKEDPLHGSENQN